MLCGRSAHTAWHRPIYQRPGFEIRTQHTQIQKSRAESNVSQAYLKTTSYFENY